MAHGHFRGCLRFSFAELKKPAIHIFFRNPAILITLPTIYSLPSCPLKWRAYEFFSGGHPRRCGVPLRYTLEQLSVNIEHSAAEVENSISFISAHTEWVLVKLVT